MRALRSLALALVLLGCGARSTAPAASVEESTNETATEGDEVAQVPDAPCSSWDPSADPTTAPLDVAEPPAGANRGRDGLRFCILRPGSGQRRPTVDDRVRVHYTGWTTDGRMFDSSVTRGQPARFPLNGVIPGWTEGVQLMVEGEKRRFWIPGNLAYEGRPGPQGTLVFDVELLRIL